MIWCEWLHHAKKTASYSKLIIARYPFVAKLSKWVKARRKRKKKKERKPCEEMA